MVPGIDHLDLRQLLSAGILPLHGHVVGHDHAPRSRAAAAVAPVHAVQHADTTAVAGTVPGFNFVTSPSVANSNLNATSADAPNDIWAVGFSNPTSPLVEQPLTEHFNGTSWTVESSPTLASGGTLRGVTALSPTNVWAVGGSSGQGAIPGGLIEHFDGTKWSVVPGDSSVNAVLNAVTAISANDIWAVGQGTNPTNGSTRGNVIEHFNGKSWSAVPVPAFSFVNDDLFGVSGDAANDVWAVGVTGRSAAARTEVLHFNGTAWSAAPAPTFFARTLAALSPTDVWAVGSSNGTAQIENFNGSTWNVVPSPSVPGTSSLDAVTAVSASDIWAVGTTFSGGTEQTLVEHFDGTSWSVVPSANPASGNTIAYAGLTAVSDGNGSDTVVAVSTLTNPNGQQSGSILQN
jgi:hypothetical protein